MNPSIFTSRRRAVKRRWPLTTRGTTALFIVGIVSVIFCMAAVWGR